MNSDLYRIVYCSRSEITGTPEEIAAAHLNLLDAARAKNRLIGVTGALVSQAGAYAQVLEGPRKSVEHIFSRVQNDYRNSGVTVCLRGPATERCFPKWSMAFADGEGPTALSPAPAVFDAVFANQKGAGEKLFALLKAHFTRSDDFLL